MESYEIAARRLPAMSLRELLDKWSPGSGTGRWTWSDENQWLWKKQPTEMIALCDDIRANGIDEPTLLGGDGRVWDGHHRVCAAMSIGLDCVPIEHALGADPSHA